MPNRKRRFRLVGWTQPTNQRKESDGVMYELGCFDSPEDAEVSKWWRLNAGWGRVEIVEIIDKQQDEATESSIQN